MENTAEALDLQHATEKLETLWNQSSFVRVTNQQLGTAVSGDFCM